MTRSKQESTAVMRLVNLTTKRDSVFMAFSFGVGPKPTPFSREDAVFAHPFWLRLCRVRRLMDVSVAPAVRQRRGGAQASGGAAGSQERLRPAPRGRRRPAELRRATRLDVLPEGVRRGRVAAGIRG